MEELCDRIVVEPGGQRMSRPPDVPHREEGELDAVAAELDDLRAYLRLLRAERPAIPQPSTGVTSAPRFSDRFRVETAAKQVCFDGETFVIEHPGMFNLLARLAEAEGELVSKEEIRKVPGCKGRLDEMIKDHLACQHPKLRSIIKSKRGHGGGYWLHLPPRGQDGV